MSGEVMERKIYLDNIRTFTVLLVVVYHVAYLFNSAGVPSNLPIRGIPGVDGLCYFVYPWFMCLLFLTAGISARYSLQRRDDKRFAKERTQKLMVPFFGGVFLLAWVIGWVNSHYVDMFGGRAVPGFVRYLVYCLSIGPLWFLLELFAASMILLLLRKADRKDRLWQSAGRCGLPFLILLVLPVWGSSFLLNVPVVTVFRNGIYWFLFLLGYFVFSHKEVLVKIKKAAVPLLAVAVVLGCAEVVFFWGENYTLDACLQHPLTNLYAWMMILAILGCAQKWLDFETPFTKYLKKRSFAIYVSHYPILSAAAYFLVTRFHPPMPAVYPILLGSVFFLTILFCEAVDRIPVVRYLLFGKKRAVDP